MANPFVHVKLHSNDLKQAREFYKQLFDWKLDEMQMPGGAGAYTMIGVGQGTGGGMMANPSPGTPSRWLAYVDVDDLAATTRKARQLGAQILVDGAPAGDFGSFSIIIDP